MSSGPDPYTPPEIVGDVDALPPVMREARGVSMYDDIIIHAVKKEGRWVQVDRKGRSQQTFRNGIEARLEQLDLEMRVAKRGKLAYVRYDGDVEDVGDMIDRIRDESRAQYGN